MTIGVYPPIVDAGLGFGAAPIQYATAASGSTTNPQTCAFPVNVRAGTVLFVLSQSLVNTESITGITDSVGSSYTELVDLIPSGGTMRFEIWRAPSAGAGANTASVTYSAVTSASKRVWVVEVGGLGHVFLIPVESVELLLKKVTLC